ncbi:unnamed protein product, partial [Allacma fusca]
MLYMPHFSEQDEAKQADGLKEAAKT